MGTDDVATLLAGIKERAEAAADFPLAEIAAFTDPDTRSVGGWIAASALDVPSLVAAVDAVLKLAANYEHLETGPPSGKEDEAAALGIRWTATKVREVITAALTGGQLGEDEKHG